MSFMKCKFCNSCLKIIRIDFDDESIIYFVCLFCGRVYRYISDWEFPQEDNSEKADKVREIFKLSKVG
jgi:RNase P subunit RPR2